MSKLYITEYQQITLRLGATIVQVPIEPPIVEQVIDFTAGAAQSNPLNSKTSLVRLNADATCSVLFGINPTATTSNQRFATNQTEFKQVGATIGYKISAISNT